jgi:hypothetical protein
MHISLIHKIYPLANECNLSKQYLVFFMSRFTPSRAIRNPARPIILPKSALLRTITSSPSKGTSGPNMTLPADETRSVEDMDRLLEIIRTLTNRHILLEAF